MLAASSIKSDQTPKIDARIYYYNRLEDRASYSTDDNSANMENQIAYHKEMEYIANRAGDFAKANHHRKM